MRLSKLLDGVEDGRMIYANGDWEREIVSLSTDSRTRQVSTLFFCLSGGVTDSHACAIEAVEKGAVAIVTERVLEITVPQILVTDSRRALGLMASVFFGEPTKQLSIIGITGTNGKTTTSYMLENILRKAGKRTGVIGTLGVRFGEKKLACDLTTPDPIELQRVLAQMVRHGVQYVVMEVSAHALHYRKTSGVKFRACIFTNLSQDHLDFFKDMQKYKFAKLRLFSSEVCPLAIVNGDEATGREIAQMRKSWEGKTLVYGLETPADAFAILTEEGLRGTECMLNVNDRLSRVRLAMLGKHNVYNALAAATCAEELGIESEIISKGLSELKRVKGRLEWVANAHGADVFVDFAHTPDGLEKSLIALRAHCKGRLVCLFGCGGNRDKGKRPKMGEIAAKNSDFTVLTSDNPRYEDPLDILGEIERGYRRFSSHYVIVSNRERAMEYALSFLMKGDILLVAGKGGEEYQEIMGIKHPFNDHAVIVQLLEKRGNLL